MPSRRPSPDLDLAIAACTPAARGYARALRHRVLAAAKLARTPLRQLSLALVDDRRMRQVHAEFLADPSTTDVVTFALEQDRRGRVTSGEIVICLAEAARVARARRHPVGHELALYAIHGMLHLSGYDDTSKLEFDRMHAREDQILSQLGLGRVFAPRNPAAGSRAGRRHGGG